MISYYSKEIEFFLNNYRNELRVNNKDLSSELQRSVECIHKHLFNPKLQISWLKAHSHIKGSHFSTHFKYYLGKSPKKYIQDLRLEVAKKVLSNKSFRQVSILELAITLGYAGKGAFNHAFKKREGISLGRWRRVQLG